MQLRHWRQVGTQVAPRDSAQPNIEVFAISGINAPVHYPCTFAVMRDLVYQPELKKEGGAEEIVLQRTDPEFYVDSLILAKERVTHPDVHLAFLLADRQLGRNAASDKSTLAKKLSIEFIA
jgi:hypothetical protein